VRSELSDSNNSLGRVPSNSQLPHNNIASNVGRILSLNSGANGVKGYPPNSQSNHEGSSQQQQGGEVYNNVNSKGVQGPRGGRHFRSASHEDNSLIGNMSRNNSNFQSERDPLPPPSGISEKVRRAEKAGVLKEAHKRAKSEYFQIENSDEDSLQSGKEDNDGVNRVRHNNFQSTPRVGSSSKSTSQSGHGKLDPIPMVQPSTEEGVLSGRKYEVPSYNQRRSQQALQQPQRGDNATPRRNSNADNDVGDPPSNGSIYPSLHPNRHESGYNRKGDFGPVVTAYKGGSNSIYNNRQQAAAAANSKDENSDWEDRGPNRRDSRVKGNPKKYYQVQPEKEKGTDDDEYGDMSNFNDALMVKAKPVIGMKPIGQINSSSNSNNGGNANGNYSNVRPQQPQPSGKGGPSLANAGSNTNSSNNIGNAGGVGVNGGNNNGNNGLNALNLNVDGHSYGDRPAINPSLAAIAAPSAAVGGIGNNGAGIGIAGRQQGNKFRPAGR